MAVAPVSLYLELEDGRVADLEIVSRAAIAFSQAVKELAFQLDPSVEIRIEFASGTPGSLSLNSLIRLLGKLKDDHPLAAGIAAGALTWFGGEAGSYAFGKLADQVTEAEPEGAKPATKEDVAAMAERVERALAGSTASPKVQEVYRTLERDPAIKGVGATVVPGQRPTVIVPRSEFRARGGGEPTERTTTHRDRTEDVHVVLVSPVLLPGERRWKFRGPQGEFGAPVKDSEFIERVLTGTTSIPMVAGIEMDIELETIEEFRDGVWVITERNVKRVRGLRAPPTQGSLLPPPSSDYDPEDDDD